MQLRNILYCGLLCAGLDVNAQAGDHECVIVFYMGKVNVDGVYTTLTDCLTWPVNEATVQLAPGEEVRITRHSPGMTTCPNAELERRVGAGSGYASITDPVLDTLPIYTHLSEPGSYYLRGISPDYGLIGVYAASLRLIIEVATDVVDARELSFHAWAVPGGIALDNAPVGSLSVMDITGKLVYTSHVAANNGMQTIALPLMPPGSYIIGIASEEVLFRRRIVVN